jgi:hypothetical protein
MIFASRKKHRYFRVRTFSFFELDLVALCDPTLSKNAGSEKTNESRLDGGWKKIKKSTLLYFFLEILSSGSILFITRGRGALCVSSRRNASLKTTHESLERSDCRATFPKGREKANSLHHTHNRNYP